MNRICSEVEMASAGGQFGAHSSAVEPPAHNRSVPGSNPGGPTKLFSVTELHFVLKPKAPLKRGFFIS